MKTYRQSFGRWGEEIAAQYLLRKGYTILARNVRTPFGEIDLIARQECASERGLPAGQATVFVEVKTRASTAFGLPEESVNPRKQAHLLASAQAYLQEHPELDGEWRIDVVAIQRGGRGERPLVTHFENAVR